MRYGQGNVDVSTLDEQEQTTALAFWLARESKREARG